MSKTVQFTRMIDGTTEEYALLADYNQAHAAGTGERVLAHLATLADWPSGYEVDRLEHSLQTATRAHRDGADEELVVCALLHDLGDMLAPENHAVFAAEVLRPYVSSENAWLVEKHGIFQGYYFWHHYGHDRNAREKYRGHPAFEKTVRFCERWDQESFDPAFDSMPLAAFEPMVHRIFAREPWKSTR